MSSKVDLFPTRSQLWQGALLHTIAHAVFTASTPALAAEVSWDGFNFSINNLQGARGTISFASDGLVAAFRDDHSERAPWHDPAYSLGSFLEPLPSGLRSLAEGEALQYLFEEWQGYTGPVITTLFWGDGDDLTAAEPWSAVVEHGAHITYLQFLDWEAVWPALQEEYEFSSRQFELVKSLYERRLAQPDTRIDLDRAERAILLSEGKEGLPECRELLVAAGIFFQ